MKSIITYIVILFCTMLHAQNNENNLKIDIRGKDCNGGLSFCTIEINTDEKQISQKFSLHKISEMELQFTINLKALTIEEQKFIFGKEVQYISKSDELYFNQDYDFELNYNSLKILGLGSKNATIKTGTYLIKLIDDSAIIILKLFSKT